MGLEAKWTAEFLVTVEERRSYTNLNAISAIDPDERGDTQQEVAVRTGISQSTICRMIKSKYLYPTPGDCVPFLTPYKGKEWNRLLMNLLLIPDLLSTTTLDPTSVNIDSKFKDMYDTIHVDEKLFYIKKIR